MTIAPGIRNATNPMIHQPNAAGPALWMTAALVMNNTTDTKIATMSNVLRTLGSMPPATRSDRNSPPCSGVVMSPSFHLAFIEARTGTDGYR